MKFLVQMMTAVSLAVSLFAHADDGKIGVVVMHGKGGSPTRHVTELAQALTRQGFLVANLEMPWSGQRDYDVDVASADNEVLAAIARFHQQGAGKIFVAGHSQGGLFALYFGSKHPVDGIIAIAPGGNPGARSTRDKLADSVQHARDLIKEGKGQEKARFSDFEGGKGLYPIFTTANNYLDWFDPDGAMNQALAMKHIPPETPVLYVAPTNDYPGLQSAKAQMFALLPKNPLTRLAEPESSHLNAPTASIQTIADWINTVVKQ